MKKIDTTDIKKKQKRLKDAAKELKAHFVGIDHIIDHVIKDIETWYVMPELLTRPVIICLWGLTGTGKTDLVRRLVKLLDFTDKYCEIELVNKGSSQYPWATSISGILSQSQRVESNEPAVILLDEIQGFRTVDENGNELFDYKFRDVWTLLSDGKLPFNVDMEYLTQLLWDYKAKEEKAKKGIASSHIISDDDDDDDDEEYDDPLDGIAEAVSKMGGPVVSDVNEDCEDGGWHYYSLKRFKTMLRLDDSVEDIALWSDSQKREVVMRKLNDPDMYEEEDYTKTLIFISGNLDEAYYFAKETEEADLEADIFNEMSQSLSVLDIKQALVRRFKPEQIARFGNVHILYPSLNRKSYETIIERKIIEISNNVKAKAGIKLVVGKRLKKLIYSNGVFPTQGTRPLFSTISEIIESPLPRFLLKAVLWGKGKISLDYEKNHIIATIGDSILKYRYEGALDKIKTEKNLNHDRKALVSVHEAGHALAYALMFEASPPQMVTTPSNHRAEGYICLHNDCGAKQLVENKIAVSMSGVAAEMLVFGEESSTWGGKADLKKATEQAAIMVRQCGMHSFNSYISTPEDPHASYLNTDHMSTNDTINQIVEQGLQKAKDILAENKALLIDIIEVFMSQDSVKPEEFQAICGKHGKKIVVEKSNTDLYLAYNTKYKKFRSDNG